MTILGIPNELLLSISENLSILDLSCLSLTCRQFSSFLTPQLYRRVQYEDDIGPLHWAAERGNAPLAELALSRGAEVDERSWKNSRRTPLHFAAAYNHSDVVRILIKHGARTGVIDSLLMTPLEIAERRRNVEATRALLEPGAAGMMCNTTFKAPSAFYAACWEGVRTMKPIIEAGFDFNSRGPAGESILHIAASSCSLRETLVYLLSQEGAKVAINSRDLYGSTPLHWVVGDGSKSDRVALLLGCGASMKLTDRDGSTAAHRAAYNGDIVSMECLEAMISAGFDINTRGASGQTILHEAVHGGKEMMQYLLERGGAKVIINAQDSQGSTPLQLAVDSDFEAEEKVWLLVRYGADAEVWGSPEDTPPWVRWLVGEAERGDLTVKKS